jgi:hypothetical protein
MGFILRGFLAACVVLKWAVVYMASALPDSILGCVGGFLSGSLGAAGAKSWWWVGPAIFVDLGLFLSIFKGQKESAEEAKGRATMYFVLNGAAAFFAQYSASNRTLEYICGIASFGLTGMLSLLLMSMTFWFPIVFYFTVRYTEYKDW